MDRVISKRTSCSTQYLGKLKYEKVEECELFHSMWWVILPNFDVQTVLASITGQTDHFVHICCAYMLSWVIKIFDRFCHSLAHRSNLFYTSVI